jgi:hypothetical protein
MQMVADFSQRQAYALVSDVLTLNGEEALIYDTNYKASPGQEIP